MIWNQACSKISRTGQCLSVVEPRLSLPKQSADRCRRQAPGIALARTIVSKAGTGGSLSTYHSSGLARHASTASAARAKKRVLDRDFIVSVLEVSATKRDAKGYLQKYTSKNPKALAEAPKFVQGDVQQTTAPDAASPLHVAIMKLRAPQEIDSETLRGIGNTLSQLRKLGLLSVVVVDCGIDENRFTFQDQAFRLCDAIDSFGKLGARLVKDIFSFNLDNLPASTPPRTPSIDVRVKEEGFIHHILRHGLIPVIPSIVSRDETCLPQPVDSNQIVLALTKYFAGLQFDLNTDFSEPSTNDHQPRSVASVERIILLDPLGGIPITGRPGGSHRYINIEQEYDTLMKHLLGPDGSPVADNEQTRASVTAHAANLMLAKDALTMLPPTASALITTPAGAANNLDTIRPTSSSSLHDPHLDFGNMVTTRRKKNPLIHNLLTDKPVYSSSLPMSRAPHNSGKASVAESMAGSTLLKKGMPLTIFPDPRESPWRPPQPGGPRLRLTDKCIDLPRLVHLIEDSFGRKLDVQDYLNRVNENLAGVIIAGEYEGGAILTWERPEGLDEQTAYDQNRYVPYLDKFAVLRRSQGSGGVADVVFSAMVRTCFPDGVSWRSRKDNPVNKWYFERSSGTNKLPGCNWTMFWTTPGLSCNHPTLRDYESVCRSVEPSWADNKHILD